MIKTRGIMARAVVFLVITSLMAVFAQPALAAQVTENKIIPAGQSTFGIDMYVNEPTKYAGIEFVLTISDENALKFESFTPKISGATASPFQTKNGLHYFGFMAAANDYAAGNTLVGTLNFTEYTGNQAVGITIVQMTVVRVDADNKSVKALVDVPYAYTVQRSGAVVTYNVTFDANGGTFAGGSSTEVISVPAGGTAVAPRNPTKAGYTFAGWDPSNFTNITSDITVTAQWRQNGGPPGPVGSDRSVNVPNTDVPTTDAPPTIDFPFTDVKNGDWFYDDVYYAWEKKLVDGTSASLFSPLSNITRGQVVTILYRAEGKPDVSEPDNQFIDVKAGTYYTEAVIWATANEIVKGYGDGTYRPDQFITRQELTAILCRYADFTGTELTELRKYEDFADQAVIYEYAREYVKALYMAEVINGKPNNRFDPLGNATRAEFTAMIHRLLNLTETEV